MTYMSDKHELTIEDRSGYLWITLPDAITMYDNKEIELKIGNSLRDRKDHVVLDFSHTRAVYSSGLGLMIRIRRFVTERGGTLSLVNVSEPIGKMFSALNIDKVFNIFTTDVEFEITREDFLKKKGPENGPGFLFVSRVERNTCYIHVSGEMTAAFDLSQCSKLLPAENVRCYLFDFSALEIVDGTGAEALRGLTGRITREGGVCRAYGASELKREMLTILGAERDLSFYPDEESAFTGTGEIK